eukprot:NODE_4377_length_789_cov_43.373112_g4354_i0.p1 GENE.NODE_4377_length_789_cov_43.373112_g4354_i0~~NODE_4377_length_789_cov_43.373112_g4354_i0.p1  ORF type:complete len:237 (+),score=58.27 NODE_4377_length_789_cov_43.373112_g4354_i0:2-712(+)
MSTPCTLRCGINAEYMGYSYVQQAPVQQAVYSQPRLVQRQLVQQPSGQVPPIWAAPYTTDAYKVPVSRSHPAPSMVPAPIAYPTFVPQYGDLPAPEAAASGAILEVTVDKANMKNADQLSNLNPLVRLKLNDTVLESERIMHTLTPEWDATFTLPVANPESDQLVVTVFLGDDEVGEGYLNLNALKINKPTYKGVAVKGGKLDLTLKAIGFGLEDTEQEGGDDSWMGFLGEDGAEA